MLYDSWSDILRPPDTTDASNFSWDYTHPLSAFLVILIARLYILSTAQESDREDAINLNQELRIHANALVEIHNKIADAIETFHPSKSEDSLVWACLFNTSIYSPLFVIPYHFCGAFGHPGWYIPVPEGVGTFKRMRVGYIAGGAYSLSLPADKWIGVGCIYGAVQRHSGASLRCVYTDVLKHLDPESQLPMTNVLWSEEQRLRWDKIITDVLASSSPDMPMRLYEHYVNIYDEMMVVFKERQVYRKFLIDHALKSRKACEELYKMIGLPAVVNFVEDLKRIIPATQLHDDPLPELSHQYTTWSVREIYDLVNEKVGGLSPPIDGKIDTESS